MLARHLLFVATRRPHNSLLAIPSESVPPQTIVQPPPYIAPPKPDDRGLHQKRGYQDILKDSQPPNLRGYPENEKQPIADQKPPPYTQEIYDSRQNVQLYDNRRNLFNQQQQQQRMSNYEYQEQVRNCQTVHMHNARNQQLCSQVRDIDQQQFYTLPTRRPQREIEPPRSVTPDITRGLGRGSLNSMHMLTKHQSQQRAITTAENEQNRRGVHVDVGSRNLEQAETRGRSVQSQSQSIVDVRNRFAMPLNLTALGYRFFTSSPASDPTKSPNADVLRNNPISPIGHGCYNNGFKSSTPTDHHGRSAPTVAERLALTATTGNNCSPIPMSGSSGRSTPVQTSSGRTTPTNLILSPTKSTMSNEELFAAIHKSKKRLNIRFNENDDENLSPSGSMNSLVKIPAGTRHSWSPESYQRTAEVPTTVQSPTSRMDFKRLLLQQSVKTSPMRLSAAEQLKLSRQQCQQQQQQSSPSTHQNPLTKVLSPRSVWRFQTPRTDVLSSTIIEDTAAEEKAMKPSPENTSPISRLNLRRQLDLCTDLASHLHIDHEVKTANLNDRLTRASKMSNANELNLDSTIKMLNQNNKTRELITNAPDDSARTPASPVKTTITNQNISSLVSRNDISTAIQYSKSSLEPKNQDPLSALESRRISNQLARAQFLASTPTNTNTSQNLYFSKRFRARSESPQHNAAQNVATRSPSAPTLETAL